MSYNSFRDREEKRQSGFRVIYDFTMGFLWTAAGIFFLLNKYIIGNMGFDSLTSSIFGIACLCYGIFRLYRGYSLKKQK
ncbi:MAG: hypothetical protein RL131_1352 [Bacteroidota bacterium]